MVIIVHPCHSKGRIDRMQLAEIRGYNSVHIIQVMQLIFGWNLHCFRK